MLLVATPHTTAAVDHRQYEYGVLVEATHLDFLTNTQKQEHSACLLSCSLRLSMLDPQMRQVPLRKHVAKSPENPLHLSYQDFLLGDPRALCTLRQATPGVC